MKVRPISVTLVAWLFIIAGAAGIVYHAEDLQEIGSRADALWVLLIRLCAITGGIFLLRGANWARWLLTSWIVYHVVISLYHSLSEVIMHIVIMFVIVILLFRPAARKYFQS